MKTLKSYENIPAGIVMLSNLVSLSIYGLGFLIIFKTGPVLSIIYLLYIIILEYRLIRHHCTNCYYWGRTCGFGKGRLSSLFFKKGDPSKFCARDMTWKDMIPDFLVSFVPFVTGIVLLILKFDYVTLFALLLLLILTSFGNGLIRGNFTCRFCEQRELGCPAEMLFNKKK